MKIPRISIHDFLLLFFAIGVIGYFLSTLVIIPFISPDPVIDSFPNSCPHPNNCTRVADTNHRADNIRPPIVQANITETMKAIEEWIGPQKILYQSENDTFVHVRWTMPLTRFRDDVLILLKSEVNNTQTVIWIQSQSRIGSYDFNTNINRVNSFIHFIESYKF